MGVHPLSRPAVFLDRDGVINRAIVRALDDAEIKTRYFNAGVETVGSTPEELAALLTTEMAKWGKLIKQANIKM